MSFLAQTNRTPKTIAKYESLYRQFERHIRRRENLCETVEVLPAKVALRFIEDEGTWEVSTARLYRAAITYILKTKHEQGDDRALGAFELLSHIHADEEAHIARKDTLRQLRKKLRAGKQRSARQKVKRFSKQDAAVLVKELAMSRSIYGPMAATWFVASTLTGLRPCEWELAKFDTDWRMIRSLVVKNAKNTNGRSHGQNRTLILSGISLEQSKVIANHMENVRNFKERNDFQGLYDGCRQIIKRVADKLWPQRLKHPTLYTARHIFSADAKSVFDKVSVAAMMGHASIDTAGEHYAPAWSSTGQFAIEPSEDDVAAVTNLNQSKIDLEMKKQLEAQAIQANAQWLADALMPAMTTDTNSSNTSRGKGGRNK